MASAAPYFIRSVRIVQIRKCSCVKRKNSGTGWYFPLFFCFWRGWRGGGRKPNVARMKRQKSRSGRGRGRGMACLTLIVFAVRACGVAEYLGFAYILRLFSYTYPTYGSWLL